MTLERKIRMKFVNVKTKKWGTVKLVVDDFVEIEDGATIEEEEGVFEIGIDEDNYGYIKGMEDCVFKNGNKLDLRLENWK